MCRETLGSDGVSGAAVLQGVYRLGKTLSAIPESAIDQAKKESVREHEVLAIPKPLHATARPFRFQRQRTTHGLEREDQGLQ